MSLNGAATGKNVHKKTSCKQYSFTLTLKLPGTGRIVILGGNINK
jgi:hypothetical protein